MVTDRRSYEIVDPAGDKVREVVTSKYAAKKRRKFWTQEKGRTHYVRPAKEEA